MDRREAQPQSNRGEVEKIVLAVAHGELTRRQFIERGLALGSPSPRSERCSAPAGEARPKRRPRRWPPPCPRRSTSTTGPSTCPRSASRTSSEVRRQGQGVLLQQQRGDDRQVGGRRHRYDVIFPTDMYVTVMQKSGLLQRSTWTTSPTSSTSPTRSFRNPRSTTPTTRTARSTRCRTCSAPPATARPSPKSRRRWTAGTALGRGLQGRHLDARQRTQHPRRRAHQAGLLLQHHQSGRAGRRDAGADRAEAPGPQVRPGQHAAQYRPGPRSDTLLGRRRRAGDQDDPCGQHRVRPAQPGYNVWADGIVIAKSSENVYAAHLFLDHMLDPKQAARRPTTSGTSAWSRRAWTTSRTRSRRRCGRRRSSSPNGVFREDVGEFNAAYDQAWADLRAA